MKENTHAPSATACKVANVRTGIKRRAVETQNTTRNILVLELEGISERAAVAFPTLSNSNRNIKL